MATHLYVWYFEKSVPGMKLYFTSCAPTAPAVNNSIATTGAKTIVRIRMTCIFYLLDRAFPALTGCKRSAKQGFPVIATELLSLV